MNTTEKFVVMLPASILIACFFFLVIDTSKNSTSNSAPPQSQTETSLTGSSDRIEIGSGGEETTEQSSEEINNSDNAKAIYTDLSILPGCRGCGRCVSIDPEHFQLNGRTASVITEENLDSAILQSAIDACPAGVIQLS